MPPLISVAFLKERKACQDQVELFKQFLAGRDEIEVTPESIRQARAFGLEVEWLVGRVGLSREVACTDPSLAAKYACDVDRYPRDDTRAAACQDPKWAYHYARWVDNCPRDDTRAAALSEPAWAFKYAQLVDKCPREDTRAATLSDPQWAYTYTLFVNQCPVQPS